MKQKVLYEMYGGREDVKREKGMSGNEEECIFFGMGHFNEM